ncbi:MAG TPA: hypothetical protein VFN10_15695 [Thermoanaerobaculia bacterium]|nr:hypothetical protein [Thermoanaerobaculia bacterium]
MSDDELLARFENCTLDPATFHHREHVRIAWLYVREHPLPVALMKFSEGLQRFAASLGSSLYHATITWAFLFLIHERVQNAPCETFDEFADANPDLLTWKPSILERYYTAETLASPRAKEAFVMPDRHPSGLTGS